MHMYQENGVLYCASSTSQGVYYYTYALNNPLKYTDPSGYQTYLSPGYMAYSNQGSGGGGFDPSDNYWTIGDGGSFDTSLDIFSDPTGGWRYSIAGNYKNQYTGETMYGYDFYRNTPYLRSHEYVDSDPNKVAATMLGVKNISFYPGVDPDGGRMALIENHDGTFTGSGIPFWMMSGSYYNHHYFLSGLKEYGDLRLLIRLAAANLNISSLLPAAISLEINGSAEGYVASSLSLIGAALAIRGPDRFKTKGFTSSGIGIGGVGVSGQLVKMRYFYLGNIDNFTLKNTFEGWSADFDVTFGEGLVGGGFISVMPNQSVKGEFLIGIGEGLGIGWSPFFLSLSGTMQYTRIH